MIKKPKNRPGTKRSVKKRRKKTHVLVPILVIATSLGIWWYLHRSQPVAATSHGVVATTHPVHAAKERNKVYTNVVYELRGQQLDIYQPTNIIYKTFPVVIYIHGGGWEINDKASEKDQLRRLTALRQAGFSVVSINYRKLPEGTFPAPLVDTLTAIRYLRANAAIYSFDARRFAAYGFSAGGTLAALAGTLDSQNPYNDGENKDTSSRLQAVVTLAGLYNLQTDLRPASADRIARLFQNTDVSVAEAGTYLTPDDPPFLLLHGAGDQFVYPVQDEYFSHQLTQAGVAHTSLVVSHADHGLNPMGGSPSPSLVTVDADITSFIIKSLYP